MAPANVLVEKNVTVPMRDGVETYGDLYRPAGGAPAPGIVSRTPYDKEGYGGLRSMPVPLKLAEAGYAVLVTDTRGRFSSQGAFHPFVDEGADGYDTVEWLAAKDFCDGNVGIFGASYFGATTMLATRERPPSLRCAASIITASDYYDDWTHYGGAFQLGFSASWGLGLAAAQLLRADHGIGDEERAQLMAAAGNPGAAMAHRPLVEMPGLSAPGVAPWWAEWLEHDTLDDFWDGLRLSRDYADFDVPIMHVGGWFDLFAIGTIRNFVGLHELGKTPQRLWMGPWSHTSYERYHGEVDFGPTGPALFSGVVEAYKRFFDQHLMGADAPAHDPAVRYFLMGANEWRDADAWPPPEATELRLHLRSGGAANSVRGDGALTKAAPDAGERADRYVYDPERPVPTEGGCLLQLPVGQPGPRDQRVVEMRDDVLCYTSEPLSEPLDIAGPVVAEVWAVTDAPDTDWTAKLVDVSPDGRALGLCDGIRRASFRDSLAAPSPVTPGEPVRYEIELSSVAYRFQAGHQLRVEVSSSNFPRFDANPNTGEPGWSAVETRPAVQQVLHDADHPSALAVWVLPQGS